MKTFSPYIFSLANNDIQDIEGKYPFWIGGRLSEYTSGISYFDSDRNIYDQYIFNENINMDRLSIYSIINLKDEIWFGGEDAILVYNIKKDFWRTYNINIGTDKSWINSFINIDDQIWLATNNGLIILNKDDKSQLDNELVDYFYNNSIYELKMTKDHIFIASETGLFIFDKQINKIYDLKSFGYKSKDFIFPSDHFNYTAITKNNDNLYFANQSGIISFNLINRQWSNVVEPSIYGSLEVKSIV